MLYKFEKDFKHYDRLIESYQHVPQDEIVKNACKNKNEIKIINPPISMLKLLQLLEKDETHYACVDAIAESCFIKFHCKDKNVKEFFDNIQLPKAEDITSILSDFIHYYIACGNGFLQKMRNFAGKWVGLNRLIPSEVQIIEKYDNYGFLNPDYIQIKNNQKKIFKGKDIIHLLQRNSLSNAWGVACKPIIIYIETLYENKQFDYNQFKNGLLIDYIIMVEGGSLSEKQSYTDSNGKIIEIDPFNELQNLFYNAKGNKNSHGTILIETPDPNAKIRLEPLRINENNFIELKKDIRGQITTYHRVPPRLISKETPGKLGGDDNSDLELFYSTVIQPLQQRVKQTLANEFYNEFKWKINPDDFDFGNIAEIAETNNFKL